MIAEALLLARQLEPSFRPSFSRETATAVLRYGAMVGAEIEHLPEASRCMDLARAEILACDRDDRSFPSGRVILADQLTNGKGRFLRHWHAPVGGVWMVLTLANTLLPEHAALYPLAAGVACCETVRHFGLNATVKWVNDVQLGGRKVAGILTETLCSARGGEEFVLIGIGLNVNNTYFVPELRNTAVAMSEFSGYAFDLTEVAATLISKLSWNIGLLHHAEATRLAADRGADDDTSHPLLTAWRSVSDTIGRRVRFGFNVVEEVQYTATVVDIDSRGHLVMRLPDGQEVCESGGEIMYV